MRSRRRFRVRRRSAMGTDILDVSDRLIAAVTNGIYQGSLVTILVALSFRVFRRTNAATRHAVWLCTLVLLVLLVVAHGFFHSRPALQPTGIAQVAATPEQEIDTPNVAAAVTATAEGMQTEIESSEPKWPGDLPAEKEQLAGQKPYSLSLTSTEPLSEAQQFSGSPAAPGATLREGESNSPSTAVESLAASV